MSTLLRVADAVRPISQEAWDRLVVESQGGPGLYVDPQFFEVTRGSIGGVEWLLQAGPKKEITGSGGISGDGSSSLGFLTDPCLKRLNRPPVCARDLLNFDSGLTSAFHEGREFVEGNDPSFPRCLIVNVTADSDAVRITSRSRVSEVKMYPLGGNPARFAGVLFLPDDAVKFIQCAKTQAELRPPAFKLEFLKTGRAVYCPGVVPTQVS